MTKIKTTTQFSKPEASLYPSSWELLNLIVPSMLFVSIAIILFRRRQKSLDSNNETAARRITPQGNNDDPDSPERSSSTRTLSPLKLIGPDAPQTFTYIVTTPPSSEIEILADSTYKSIYRQLIINPLLMTFERRYPFKIETNPTYISPPSSPKSGRRLHRQGDYENEQDKETTSIVITSSANTKTKSENTVEYKPKKFTSVKGGLLPLSSILDTHSFNSVTLELTISISNKTEKLLKSLEMNSCSVRNHIVSDPITLDDWKKQHISQCRYDIHHDENAIRELMMSDNNSIDSEYAFEPTIPIGDVLGLISTGSHNINLKSDPNHGNSKQLHQYEQKEQEKVSPHHQKSNDGNYETKHNEEYTFQSNAEAASFQTYYLALMIVGREIYNMYSALESIYMLSEEYVESFNHENCHGILAGGQDDASTVIDNNFEGNQGIIDSSSITLDDKYTHVGIALDDVNRCLGGIKFIKKTISRYYAYHNCARSTSDNADNQYNNTKQKVVMSNTTTKGAAPPTRSSSSSIQDTDNRNKNRLRLGYIDFFRLFVPSTTIFEGPYDSPTVIEILDHQKRIAQLLKLRKLVGFASQRVCAYYNAMKVVHTGWKYPDDDGDSSTLTESDQNHTPLVRRVTHDYEYLNAIHDQTATNEYYESVIGDSLNPLYSLVGCHLFHIPPEENKMTNNAINSNRISKRKSLLNYNNDVVKSIPSLQKIIERNPTLDFFVAGIFYQRQKIACIVLYVYNSCHKEGDTDEGYFVRTNDSYQRERDFDLSLSLSNSKPRFLSTIGKVGQLIRSTLDPYHCNSTTHCPVFNYYENKLAKISAILPSRKYFDGSMDNNHDNKTLPLNYFTVNYEVNSLLDRNISPSGILKQLVVSTRIESYIIDFQFIIKDKQKYSKDQILARLRLVHVQTQAIHSLGNDEDDTEVVNVANPEAVVTPLNIELDDLEDEDPLKEGIDSLKEVLEGISVPVRQAYLNRNFGSGGTSNDLNESLSDISVLDMFTTNDLRRFYVGSGNDLREAAVRVVQTAAWKGVTFPIDTRRCQIELESGQFFTQGVDLENNPILYFRNMCIGPWRKDIDASIFAILHQLEAIEVKYARSNPNYKCTVIVLMGKPSEKYIVHKSSLEETEIQSDESSSVSITNNNVNTSVEGKKHDDSPSALLDEDYFIHTNFQYVHQLIGVISKHYPERLARALVIPNGGWEKLLGTHGLRRYIHSKNTRAKVKIIDHVNQLKEFVAIDELSTLVGGNS